MKRLAFLGFTIATLMAAIQVQAQQYDPVANCVRFPQQPNPEAETRYLLSHPNIRVCPGPNPNPEGQRGVLGCKQYQDPNLCHERSALLIVARLSLAKRVGVGGEVSHCLVAPHCRSTLTPAAAAARHRWRPPR